MNNKRFINFWEDLSEQEKDLVVAMGNESDFPHRPEDLKPQVGDKFALPKSRDELPEQARGLWDLFHK